MILVSLDIKDHVIRLVSIERGTGVPILLDGYEASATGSPTLSATAAQN